MKTRNMEIKTPQTCIVVDESSIYNFRSEFMHSDEWVQWIKHWWLSWMSEWAKGMWQTRQSMLDQWTLSRKVDKRGKKFSSADIVQSVLKEEIYFHI